MAGTRELSATDRVVFGVAAGAVAAIVVWGLVAPDNLDSVTADMLDWLVTNMGWLFVIAASSFVVFALWLAASRYGRVPTGQGR